MKKSMKKSIVCGLVLSMLLSLFTFGAAAENITIYVNEQYLQCDAEPFFDNGRTMVPMRNIFEALDAEVSWEWSTETITATKNNTEIILQINNPLMYINGAEEKLDVAPIIVGDYTFVPIRAVSQSLNASVEWLNKTYSVYINSPVLYEKDVNWTESEVIMYAPDGRTINVPESEVEAHKNVGWYSSRAEAQAAYRTSNNASYNQTTSSYSNSETVYVGRTGNKYHYQSCRTLKGKGIPISMGEALAQGRTSCKVCRR